MATKQGILEVGIELALVNRIGDYNTTFRYEPGLFDFETILNDKSSASWEWIEPFRYKDWRIVWLRFPPQFKGDKSRVFYAFVTSEKYVEMLKRQKS